MSITVEARQQAEELQALLQAREGQVGPVALSHAIEHAINQQLEAMRASRKRK